MDRWTQYRSCNAPSVGTMENIFLKYFPTMKDRMQATPQDPTHHGEGDVWVHTQMVLEEVRQHPRYIQGTPIEQVILDWAAILHDIAKPFTTKNIEGKIIAPHHSKKGAVWARDALWRLGMPIAVREQICQLIVYHQTPFFALSHNTETGEFLAKKISSDVDLSLLCALAESDIRGRLCVDQDKKIEDIHLFAELCKELDCFDREYNWPNKYTRHHYVLSHGNISSDHLYHDSSFEVVLLSGLPAAGKDTWVQGQDLPMISYDLMREKMKAKHGENIGTIVHAVHDQAKEFLRKKQPFVWNATHLSAKMREPATKLVRSYGGKIKVLCFEAPKEEVLSRNKSRNNTLTNKKLLDMTSHWEMPWAWEFESQEIVDTSCQPKKTQKLKI